eukprot:COSAG01_NODE_1177_length_11372_cov_4.507851_11_plen_774_part_00
MRAVAAIVVVFSAVCVTPAVAPARVGVERTRTAASLLDPGGAARKLRACGWGSNSGACTNASCSRELPGLLEQCQALLKLQSWVQYDALIAAASGWSTSACPRNCLLWEDCGTSRPCVSMAGDQCLVWDSAPKAPVSAETFDECKTPTPSTCSEQCRRTVVPLVSSCSQLLGVVELGVQGRTPLVGCVQQCGRALCGRSSSTDDRDCRSCHAACRDAKASLNTTDPASRIPWHSDLLRAYSMCTSPTAGGAAGPYPGARGGGASGSGSGGRSGHHSSRLGAGLMGLAVLVICVTLALSGKRSQKKRSPAKRETMDEQLLRPPKAQRPPHPKGRQARPVQPRPSSPPPLTASNTNHDIRLVGPDDDITELMPWAFEASSSDEAGLAWDEAASHTDTDLGSDKWALAEGSTDSTDSAADGDEINEWYEGVSWGGQIAAAEVSMGGERLFQDVLGTIDESPAPSQPGSLSTLPSVSTRAGAGEDGGPWQAVPHASSSAAAAAAAVWARGFAHSGQLDDDINVAVGSWQDTPHGPLVHAPDFLLTQGTRVENGAMTAASSVARQQRGAAGQQRRRKIPVADSGDSARPFKCTVPGCNYTATRRRYVGEHMHTHTGFKPHECPYDGCSYRAAGTGHLFRHMRTHTGEKPYKCDWPGCAYASSQPTHLKIHKRKHTGEKPFKCTVAGCDYVAARAWYVTRHMRKHSADEKAQAAGGRAVGGTLPSGVAVGVGVGAGGGEGSAALGMVGRRLPAPDAPPLVMTNPGSCAEPLDTTPEWLA